MICWLLVDLKIYCILRCKLIKFQLFFSFFSLYICEWNLITCYRDVYSNSNSNSNSELNHTKAQFIVPKDHEVLLVHSNFGSFIYILKYFTYLDVELRCYMFLNMNFFPINY